MNVWCHLPTIFNRRYILRLSVLVCLSIALITTLFFSTPLRAAPGINETLSFQGRLSQANGGIVPDGHYNMQFKIYEGGTGAAANNPGGTRKWTENYVNNNNVKGIEVKNGYFSVNLGSRVPFGDNIDWNQDTIWLSMNVAGSAANCAAFGTAPCIADGEMIPMKRITAVPQAMNSRTVGGKTADNFVQLAQGVQTDSSMNTSSIFINKTGSGNLIQLQNTATDVFSVNNSGDLTFGNNANHTISIAGSSGNTDGRELLVVAGNGGVTGNNSGGNLVLQGGSGAGLGSSGSVIIQSNASNSNNALSVQRASGEDVMRVDTTNNRLVVGDSAGNKATPALVSQATAIQISGSNFSVNTTSTSGNLLVAVIGMNSTTAGVSDVTDSAGNVWRLATHGYGRASEGTRTEIWYAQNATAVSSVDVALSSPTGATAQISEYSGIAASDSLVAAHGQGNELSTSHSTPDVITDSPNSLIIGGFSFLGTSSVSQPSNGWTPLTDVVDNTKESRAAYRIATSPGEYQASWTIDPADYSGSVIAAFSAATSDNSTSLFVVDSGAENPDGVNGAIYYNTGADKLRCFQGGAWVDCISSSPIKESEDGKRAQVGDGDDSSTPTLLTVDKATSPPVGGDHEALLGSMYYDTTAGKLQCYEAEGWGPCSASPDTFITISPEYTNSVTNGSSSGAMTSDICSDTLNINDGSSNQPSVCSTNETYNFYKWTSTESSEQTRSIYFTYQLPSSFKEFVPESTSVMGRTDNAKSHVEYQIYRNNSTSGLTACGSVVAVSSGQQTTWKKAAAANNSDPSKCSFSPGDSVVFRINLKAFDNANAYVSNLGFAFSNQ